MGAVFFSCSFRDAIFTAASVGVLRRSPTGGLPESFLRGAGVPDTFIEYAASLIGNPIEYYTCFLSYSSKDDAFARRLYADLQAKGIRTWFAPEDLKIGDRFRSRIDESIRLHDKLVLVLSASSSRGRRTSAAPAKSATSATGSHTTTTPRPSSASSATSNALTSDRGSSATRRRCASTPS